MVNNLESIKPLLDFSNPNMFYFVQMIQRKKDASIGRGIKVQGTNNNSRTIKSYFISNMEYLHKVFPEMVKLCDLFNARASINLNRRDYRKTALRHLKLTTDNILNNNQDKLYKSYDSTVGKNHDEPKNNSKWVVDIDKEEITFLPNITNCINLCEPFTGPKILTKVPSKTGLHLITKPFNRKQFKELLDQEMDKYTLKLSIDIQTNNPTNLYIP